MIDSILQFVYFVVKWIVIILGGSYVVAVVLLWAFLLGGIYEMFTSPLAVFVELHPISRIFTTTWCYGSNRCFIGLRIDGLEFIHIQIFK